jgi:hypothetical protein
MSSIVLSATYETMECCECHVVFAMPSDMVRRRREDGKRFFCPSGHFQSFTDSEVRKLQRELQRERQKRDQAEAAAAENKSLLLKEREKIATIKVRIANGVCPCCNRTFVNVRRHMKNKHPDLAAKVL